MDKYYAKSHPVETIRQHTDKLLDLLRSFASLYPQALSPQEYKLIELASECHDKGKTAYIFQKKICSVAKLPFHALPEQEALYAQLGYIPHGYLSPAFLPIKELKGELTKDELTALVSAVYYHHVRKALSQAELTRAIQEDLVPRLGDSIHLNQSYFTRVMISESMPSEELWRKYAVVKGTLNRLDYAASAGSDTVELPRTQNGDTLGQRVETRLTQRFALRPVQEYMKAHHNDNLVVTASTGVGKTEAACLWSGGEKLFYTLPLKVSINAIYKRLTGENDGEYGLSELCTLLHSEALNVLLEEEAEDDDGDGAMGKYDMTRLFSYPVTVCTADQLFTFVYRYQGCEILPSVLKYSYLVIDELQAYSPNIAAKLIIGLKLISDFGGRFAVMTATMPPILEDAMRNLGIPFEQPEPFCLDMPRHHLTHCSGDFDYDEIAAQGARSKVLVICNTIKKACEAYDELCRRDSQVHLLHSRYKIKHRKMLEDRIMEFSRNDDVGIWITTQIVEASLDIDFDFLHTEMCAADSLLQRMGRVWRKREYSGNGPNVFVYSPASGVGTVYDKDIYGFSLEYLPRYCGRIFSEAEKIKYISQVYSTQKLSGTAYEKTFWHEISILKTIPFNEFSADDAKKRLRDIQSICVIDDEDYNLMLSSGELDDIGSSLLSGNKKEKASARERFLSRTISYDPRYHRHNSPDRTPISYRGNNRLLPTVFRSPAKYDFDEIALTGKGLLVDEEASESFQSRSF